MPTRELPLISIPRQSPSQKREANARVVEMMLPTGKQMANVQHHSEPTAGPKEEVFSVGC